MSDLIRRQDAIEVVEKYFSDVISLNPDVCTDGIRSLPSAWRWIPVSERLPDDVEIGEDFPIVIFCDSKGNIHVGFCEHTNYGVKWWHATQWESEVYGVIAWMPLPEPYKRGEANDTPYCFFGTCEN